jgi:hypothetical protein
MKVPTVVYTVLLPSTVLLGVVGTNIEGLDLYTKTGF